MLLRYICKSDLRYPQISVPQIFYPVRDTVCIAVLSKFGEIFFVCNRFECAVPFVGEQFEVLYLHDKRIAELSPVF